MVHTPTRCTLIAVPRTMGTDTVTVETRQQRLVQSTPTRTMGTDTVNVVFGCVPTILLQELLRFLPVSLQLLCPRNQMDDKRQIVWY